MARFVLAVFVLAVCVIANTFQPIDRGLMATCRKRSSVTCCCQTTSSAYYRDLALRPFSAGPGCRSAGWSIATVDASSWLAPSS
jgi:hypothetical protein